MLECTEQSIVLGGLLVLHRPDLILEMCTTNCSTKQPCMAPAGHFVKAANRLALNQQQLTHLRLMLQHYNRRCAHATVSGRVWRAQRLVVFAFARAYSLCDLISQDSFSVLQQYNRTQHMKSHKSAT